MNKWFRAKKFWFAIILILAVVFFLVTIMGGDKGLEVLITSPVKATINQTIVISGQLQAIDSDIIRIAPGTHVETVAVKEGDLVVSGQMLASGDTTDLLLQKDRLLLTKAQLEKDIAEISDPTKKSVETGIESRITQARSTVSTLEAKLNDAKKRLEDIKVLYSSGSVAKSELDTQTNLVTELTNQLLGARASLNALLAERADISPDQALRLSVLDTQLQQVEVDLSRIEENIQKITYSATLDGVVTRVIPVAGRNAGQDTYIRVDDLSGYVVESFVPQEDALYLKSGQLANIAIKGKDTIWTGTVQSVGQYAAVEAASGSQAPRVRVVLQLDALESNTVLPIGFEAEATVLVGTAQDAWTVKREAIRTDANNIHFLWIVVDGKATTKTVTIDLMDNTYAAITGIDGTEEIVALPYEEITVGAKIVSVSEVK